MSHTFSDSIEWCTNELTTPTSTTTAMLAAAAAVSAQPIIPSNMEPSTTPNPSQVASTNVHGQLICEWEDCLSVFPNSTTLYRHLCDEHIGRFRQGNRCLECRWGQCGVRTVKRDHITSHLKVHVPFRPFECEICGGTFKRSHDLKKHIRRHARSYQLSGSVELRRQPRKAALLRKQRSPLASRRTVAPADSPVNTMMMNGHISPTHPLVHSPLALSPSSPLSNTVATTLAATTTANNYSYASPIDTTLCADPSTTTSAAKAAAIAAAISAIDSLVSPVPMYPSVLSPAPTPPAPSPASQGYPPSVASSPALLGLVDTMNDERVVFDALAAVAAASSGADHLGLGIHPSYQYSEPELPIQPSFQPLPPQSSPLPSTIPSSHPAHQQAWVGW